MITKNKIQIFKKYLGDVDGWARSARKKELLQIDDEDWQLIEGLIQDINLVKTGSTSKSYSDNLESKLEELCDNRRTIELLRKTAEKF